VPARASRATSRFIPEARLGERCLVHSGAVIGADGFGFAREADGAWVKIPQVGRVLIGDDVEIGAGTTIDRGALGDTVIGDGVKLDNQIQVGHNVRIGAHTAMAGCVGIAGSAVIGARCTVGGGAVILGHLRIADDVNVSAGTLVAKSIAQRRHLQRRGALPRTWRLAEEFFAPASS
jgi:UDP-3-O-[3-hydroxymyristoyl] glucosamine N-acyltransferase